MHDVQGLYCKTGKTLDNRQNRLEEKNMTWAKTAGPDAQVAGGRAYSPMGHGPGRHSRGGEGPTQGNGGRCWSLQACRSTVDALQLTGGRYPSTRCGRVPCPPASLPASCAVLCEEGGLDTDLIQLFYFFSHPCLHAIERKKQGTVIRVHVVRHRKFSIGSDLMFLIL